MPPKKKVAEPVKGIMNYFGTVKPADPAPRVATAVAVTKRSRSPVDVVDDDSPPPAKRAVPSGGVNNSSSTAPVPVAPSSASRDQISTPPRRPPAPAPKAASAGPKASASSKSAATVKSEAASSANTDSKAAAADAGTPPKPPPKPRGKWMGPRDTTALNPGSAKIPRGPCDVLSGLSFVVSGRLESLDRDQAAELIKRHGGAVREAVTKLTSFLLKGEDCGAKKIEKANELRTRIIDEPALLAMIADRTRAKGLDPFAYLNDMGGGASTTTTPVAAPASGTSGASAAPQLSASSASAATTDAPLPLSAKVAATARPAAASAASALNAMGVRRGHGLPWVERYAPRTLKDMVGGGGAPAKRMAEWLESFDANVAAEAATGKPLTPAFRRAMLVSGSPGCGKTTTVYLVGRAAGYDVREMNASEKRAAADIKLSAGAVASSTSLLKYVGTLGATYTAGEGGGVARQASLQGAGGAAPADRLLLVMDEVDGCDTGGVAALIKVIQTSKNPVVCICNDRYNRKIRSLVKYCIDVRVPKQPAAVVAKWLHNVTTSEGLSVPLPALERLVTTSGGDVRHLLNLLQSWASTRSVVSYDEAERLQQLATLDAEVSIFAVPEFFLNGTRSATPLPFRNLQSLYYAGEFVDLFVHENYVSMQPSAAATPAAAFQRMIVASEAMAIGDAASAAMMREGKWSLSGAQFVLSAYYPASLVRGKFVPPSGASSWLDTKLRFPAALGEQSRRSKALRVGAALAYEINATTAAAATRPIGGLTARELAVNVVGCVTAQIVAPLLRDGKDGVAAAAGICKTLGLPKDEVVQVLEWGEVGRERKRGFKIEPGVAGRGGRALPIATYSAVPPAVKAAFTRAIGHVDSVGRALKQGGGGVGAIGQAHEEGEVVGLAEDVADDDGDGDDGDSGDDGNGSAPKPKTKPAAKRAAGRRPASEPARGRPASSAVEDQKSSGPRTAAPAKRGRKRAASSSDDD